MTTTKKDYQKLNGELDEVMAKLQTDDISVDEALVCYERGMQLVQELETYLKDAENKVQKIKASFDKKG